MPYKSNSDLPSRVKEHLPEHAQTIYREAFNSAYEEYKDPEKRREDSGQEETAHKVAWSAVEKEYHKEGSKWVADPDANEKSKSGR
jgi:cation transport regulator